MKHSKRITSMFLIGILFLIGIPKSYAFSLDPLIYSIQSFLSNTIIQATLSFFFFFMILLSIFTVALKRLPLFKNQSRQVKGVAVGFSLLGSLGIYFSPTRDFITTAFVINSYAGIFGTLLFSALIGLSFYYFFEGLTQCLRRSLSILSIGISLLFFGGILHNETWTSLGVLAIVIAIILALFCIQSNNEKEPEPPEPPQPPEPPGPEPPPEEPPDFTEQLNELERLLREYEQEFQQFMIYANDILQTNYDHIHEGGYHGPINPPVSGDQWNRLIQSFGRLRALENEINSIIQRIQTDPRFGNIPHQQLQRLTALLTQHSSNIRETQTFYQEFVRRYNNGEGPIP